MMESVTTQVVTLCPTDALLKTPPSGHPEDDVTVGA